MGVCSYEVVLKNGDTKGQLMSLQQTLRQEIHAKIGAQTAEESAKRKVCFPSYLCLPTALHHLSATVPMQTDTIASLVHAAITLTRKQCMNVVLMSVKAWFIDRSRHSILSVLRQLTCHTKSGSCCFCVC